MILTNLYEETRQMLEIHKKTFDDVEWIGIKSLAVFNKGKFIEEMKKIDYDSGYGSAEINSDLMLVGDDWWLERGEYDGAEWWKFQTVPTKPKKELTYEEADREYWGEDYE